MEVVQMNWMEFYSALATKLLTYKTDRQKLISKIQSVFSSIEKLFPTMDQDRVLTDLDPFTLFGTFNKGITNSNRITILKEIATKFGIEAPIPKSFDGIPVLNNMNAVFFAFREERDPDDIQHLWDVFEAALTLADTDNQANREHFVQCYNTARKQKYVKWKITMGLYWMRPYAYINLDEKNRTFIANSDNMPADFVTKYDGFKTVPDGETYLAICDDCKNILKNGPYKYKNFPELSCYAWIASKEGDQSKTSESENSGLSKAAPRRWMKPIIQALRDLNGAATPQELYTKIAENENLSPEFLAETTPKKKVSVFETQVAFARYYLAFGGYIDRDVPGKWVLTEKSKTVDMTDELATAIIKDYNKIHKKDSVQKQNLDDFTPAMPDEGIESIHYWLYSPGENASRWEEYYDLGIMAIGWDELGDLCQYPSREEIRHKMQEMNDSSKSYVNISYATWQFANEMKIGDVVFVKKGKSKIVGKGIVTSDYEYEDEQSDHYKNTRQVDWTVKGEWNCPHTMPIKTLTDITQDTEYVETLKNLIEEEGTEEEEVLVKKCDPYLREDFLEEVYMSEDNYDEIVEVLKEKKNIIFQGAPGVGKTFTAKRLAYSMIEVKDTERVIMVQFHQSYSYEDLVMGFRPKESGFELKKGTFYNFCKNAQKDEDNAYFFIIDEINRGNISRIFGELFMLIEKDKRGPGVQLQLLYNNEKFFIPKNVFIIGMMNTADRSLAMIDYALRRRFAFVDLKPGFETDQFKKYQNELNNHIFNDLIDRVKELNAAITDDTSLGEGFCIGHSYFCNLRREKIDSQLKRIVKCELIPLLKEYWFDSPDNVKDWRQKLIGVFE